MDGESFPAVLAVKTRNTQPLLQPTFTLRSRGALRNLGYSCTRVSTARDCRAGSPAIPTVRDHVISNDALHGIFLSITYPPNAPAYSGPIGPSIGPEAISDPFGPTPRGNAGNGR